MKSFASATSALFAAFAAVVTVAGGCNADAPPRGPEATCTQSCRTHVGTCSPEACWRGCNLVLDRLLEHEGDRVLACVARGKTSCDDRAWSRCAARIGVHADGGPPAPAPPKDDDLGDDGD